MCDFSPIWAFKVSNCRIFLSRKIGFYQFLVTAAVATTQSNFSFNTDNAIVSVKKNRRGCHEFLKAPLTKSTRKTESGNGNFMNFPAILHCSCLSSRANDIFKLSTKLHGIAERDSCAISLLRYAIKIQEVLDTRIFPVSLPTRERDFLIKNVRSSKCSRAFFWWLWIYAGIARMQRASARMLLKGSRKVLNK